jgi:F-type H+-transporting ATPase subunit delta
MAGKGNARRYAQAVFEIAQENKELVKWQNDLRQLVVAVSTGSLLDALESPGISIADKARFLKESMGNISPMVMNLALLLISKSRIALIRNIAGEYNLMLDEFRGVQNAEVTTAVPLDDREETGIKTQLGVLTGKKIEIKTDVDPGILGGVVARVGGKLLDGSTRSKLAALKKQLESGGR